MKLFTPSQIVKELDKYIIGQTEAKRAVAIAIRNRWRRQQVKDFLREEIMPNNIILIGPTEVQMKKFISLLPDKENLLAST